MCFSSYFFTFAILPPELYPVYCLSLQPSTIWLLGVCIIPMNDLRHDGEGVKDNFVLAPLPQFRNIVVFCPASCLPFLNLFILVLARIVGWRSLCFLGLAVLAKMSSPQDLPTCSKSLEAAGCATKKSMSGIEEEIPFEPSSITFARELAGRPSRPAPRSGPPDLQNNGVDVLVIVAEF